jgi:arylsulfatase A-like enzyme
MSAAALALLLAGAAAAAPAPPNVLLVVLDAARADRLTPYGYGRPTTPALAALAAEGALFERHYAAGTDTYSSVPRLLSSRPLSLPLFHAALSAEGARPETAESLRWEPDAGYRLLPRALSAAGWRTALVSAHPAMDPSSALGRAFGDVLEASPLEPPAAAAALAASWLRENAKDGPFFLYVHLMAPHGPYPPDPAAGPLAPPETPGLEAVRRRMSAPLDVSAASWSAAELAVLSSLYDAKLRAADGAVAALLAELDRLGLAQDTLVAVTADHGELLGEHGRILHGGPAYEELLRVPLLLRYPRAVPARRRSAALTSALDLAPTVLDYCGVRPEGASFAGRSLRAVLAGEAGATEVYGEGFLRAEGGGYTAGLDPEGPLSARLESLLEPHRRRLASTPRRAPPESPFTLPLTACAFAPDAALARVPLAARREDLPSGPGARPWVLSEQGHAPGLVRHPEKAGGPLRVSCPLPRGRYRAWLRVEPLDGAAGPAKLRYRAGGRGAFRPLPGDGGLGLLAAGDGGLTLELDAPALPALRRVESFLFDPEGARPQGDRPAGAESLRRAREGLRALGYLDAAPGTIR